nr:(5-formylfuran-3-yl)methyl phosphate synthase [Azospirillum oleiclasticum]
MAGRSHRRTQHRTRGEGVTRLLASVADLAELALAAGGGADILDLKDPAAGALGAWPSASIVEAVALVRTWPQRPPLSATVGDLPMEPARVVGHVMETAALGVDYVKIGLYPDGDPAGCLDALAPVAQGGASLVAVFFADLWEEFTLLPAVTRAGFAGAMLDTAGKGSGSLLRHKDASALRRFVEEARAPGLLTGFAGSLTLADIPALLPLRPDYLGFRGALCAGGDRGGVLDTAALGAVRSAIPGPRAVA